MILVDANLLLYAFDTSSPFHESAHAWLEDAISAGKPVGIGWITLFAFLRIATHRKIFADPLTVHEAVGLVDEWLSTASVELVHPGNRHWQILRRLIAGPELAGALVSDAHIAALAIEHEATLYTADTDFRRFEGLRFVNPLAPHRPAAPCH